MPLLLCAPTPLLAGHCLTCGLPCAPEEEHGCDHCTEAADEARASAHERTPDAD